MEFGREREAVAWMAIASAVSCSWTEKEEEKKFLFLSLSQPKTTEAFGDPKMREVDPGHNVPLARPNRHLAVWPPITTWYSPYGTERRGT